MNGKKMRKGNFTLIELLVVIGIIGILIGILLPAIGSSIAQGRMTKVKAQAKQLAFAVEGYMQDYGAYPFNSETPAEITDNHTVLSILGGDNPRKKVYFPNTGKTENPFNAPYWIAVDANYDNAILLPAATYRGTTMTSTTINSQVVVYSWGNKAFIKSWE